MTAPLVRLGDIVVLGVVADGYSHVGDAISELGAIGAETEVAHRAATVGVAVLQGAFAAGLWRRGHRFVSAAIAASAIGYAGSALFAPSPGLPLPGEEGFQTRDALHAAFGVPTGVALVAAPVLGLRLRLGKATTRWTRVAAAASVALGAVSLALSGASTRGLWQRAFNVPAFAWQAYLASVLFNRRAAPGNRATSAR